VIIAHRRLRPSYRLLQIYHISVLGYDWNGYTASNTDAITTYHKTHIITSLRLRDVNQAGFAKTYFI